MEEVTDWLVARVVVVVVNWLVGRVVVGDVTTELISTRVAVATGTLPPPNRLIKLSIILSLMRLVALATVGVTATGVAPDDSLASVAVLTEDVVSTDAVGVDVVMMQSGDAASSVAPLVTCVGEILVTASSLLSGTKGGSSNSSTLLLGAGGRRVSTLPLHTPLLLLLELLFRLLMLLLLV